MQTVQIVKTKPSRKLLAEWSWDCSVGIWNNETESVRLYSDRAIHKSPYVKWVNNSGSLAETTERYTGQLLEQLKAIAQQEVDDDADYEDRVRELLFQDRY